MITGSDCPIVISGPAQVHKTEMGLLNSNPAVLGHFPPSLYNRDATLLGRLIQRISEG